MIVLQNKKNLEKNICKIFHFSDKNNKFIITKHSYQTPKDYTNIICISRLINIVMLSNNFCNNLN